jgi:hypothetical protein
MNLSCRFSPFRASSCHLQAMALWARSILEFGKQRCFKNRAGHNAEAFRETNEPNNFSSHASQDACKLPNTPWTQEGATRMNNISLLKSLNIDLGCFDEVGP